MLDAELELFTAQADGSDTSEIQKRVNNLTVECARQVKYFISMIVSQLGIFSILWQSWLTYNNNYFREYYQRQDHQVVEAASVEVAIYREWDEAQEAILEEVVGIEEEVRMLTIHSIIIILELNWHTKFLRK